MASTHPMRSSTYSLLPPIHRMVIVVTHLYQYKPLPPSFPLSLPSHPSLLPYLVRAPHDTALLVETEAVVREEPGKSTTSIPCGRSCRRGGRDGRAGFEGLAG